jgi:uncharacterized protein YqjF (DUF2071 family)
MNEIELAIACALAAARVPIPESDALAQVHGAGVPIEVAVGALGSLRARGLIDTGAIDISLSSAGVVALLDAYAALEAALDPSPRGGREDCPTIPWLTTVQTEWIDAVSINWAVDPGALARILPAPLEPELHKGTGWVQVLISSLRDMRPQGMASLFGICFYQISYRAAVVYTTADGVRRRGGYFVRSETNHDVMRAVGNRLTEFKFHDFGAAEVVMVRDGNQLTVGVDPVRAGGKVFAQLDTTPSERPPAGSVWTSIHDLHEPLVECYDALGVDRDQGWLYVLTIDRDPWNPRFVAPESVYCEYFDKGALAGAGRLDSVLHFARCAYRWRPLRREPLP